MNDVILKGIESFGTENINDVYQRCYFQLTEERTAIIYEIEDENLHLKITVDKDPDSQMLITDLATGETTGIFVTDGNIVCEDDNLDIDMCNSIVGRYLSLMDSFVQFAKDDE